MNPHPTLQLLGAHLSSHRPHVQLLFVAAGIKHTTKRKSNREKKKRVVESHAENEQSEPEKPRVSPEELQRRIAEHNKIREDLREKLKERERKRVENEIARAMEDALEAQMLEEERKRQREKDIQERLEAIQQRREKRELEHEVSKRRSRAVRHEPSSVEVLKTRALVQERDEEERRKMVLNQIHERYHAPVMKGVDTARDLLERSKELARQRAAEMRRHRDEVDESAQSFYQGKLYEEAMRQFARARHGPEDHRHDQQYRLVKMNEYGRVVGEMTKKHHQATSVSRSATASPQPLFCGLSVEERRKQGDDFMRTAGAKKLPPGLKLQPLRTPVDETLQAEVEMVRDREKKGLQYLRELREKGELVRGQREKEPFNKSVVVDQIKQLRVQTNLLERKLLYGQQQSRDSHVSRGSNGDNGSKRQASRIHFSDDSTGNLQEDNEASSYIDVVNAKLEMLRKLEELRRRAPRDDSKW